MTNPVYLDLINQILSYVALACAPIVAGFVIAMLRKLAAKFGFEGVALDKMNLESEIHVALRFGIQQVLPQIEQFGWNSPQVQTLILKTATAYFHEKFPDRTVALGGNASDVFAALSGRLPDAVTQAAASPATPPADPAPVPTPAGVPVAPPASPTIVLKGTP